MPKTKAFVDSDDDASSNTDSEPKKKTKVEKPAKKAKVNHKADLEVEEAKKPREVCSDEAKENKNVKATVAAAGAAPVEEEEECEDTNDEKEKPTTKKSTNKKETATKIKTASKKAKSGEEEMHEIGTNRFISVSEFKGHRFVNIREYYEKEGKLLPGKKGISLKLDEWNKLKEFVETIDDEL